MKILLIGEYSRLHNSLKEGLTKLGHEVTLVGSGDGFKDYPVDIKISSSILNFPVLKFISKVLLRLFRLNIVKLESYFIYKSLLSKLTGYDVVQLINERVINSYPSLDIKIIKRLASQNKKLFLLSCGADFSSIKYANDKQMRYSILTPYHETKSEKEYEYVLNYLSKSHQKLVNFLMQNIEGIIASDMDYHLPLREHPKYLGLIPNGINVDKIEYQALVIKDKIKIFHGVNTGNQIKKGSVIIQNALAIISQKYPEKVQIISTSNVPYASYIQSYNSAHILMDQVYSYDQGYNALEAMAKGKAVFTGVEKEVLNYYNLEENTIAINALPDAQDIAAQLEKLIHDPQKIRDISKNARAFIEREHHYIEASKSYLKLWEA